MLIVIFTSSLARLGESGEFSSGSRIIDAVFPSAINTFFLGLGVFEFFLSNWTLKIVRNSVFRFY